MKPRRLDSETIVSRLATDGPGSSAGVVCLASVTVVSSGTGGRGLLRTACRTAGGRTAEGPGGNSRTSAGARPGGSLPSGPTALRVSILVPLDSEAQSWGEGRSQMEILLIIVILI